MYKWQVMIQDGNDRNKKRMVEVRAGSVLEAIRFYGLQMDSNERIISVVIAEWPEEIHPESVGGDRQWA